MRYLLNSAVVTAPGRYEYRLVSVEEARTWYAPPAGERLRREVRAALESGESLAVIARRLGVGRDRVAHQRDRAPDGPISAIGYAETAAALGELLGATVEVNRRSIAMQPGDEALVFRLVFPPGTQRIDPRDKGALGNAILAGHYELGILRKEK